MQKQSNRLIIGILASLALVAALSVPAAAHHGWGGNSDQESELTGTLEVPVSLAGPHATMRIQDADGQIWDITLAPPARTDRAGLKEGMIPVGAEVTVSGHRNSDPNRREIKTERVTWNGTNYDVYANRL